MSLAVATVNLVRFSLSNEGRIGCAQIPDRNDDAVDTFQFCQNPSLPSAPAP